MWSPIAVDGQPVFRVVCTVCAVFFVRWAPLTQNGADNRLRIIVIRWRAAPHSLQCDGYTQRLSQSKLRQDSIVFAGEKMRRSK